MITFEEIKRRLWVGANELRGSIAQGFGYTYNRLLKGSPLESSFTLLKLGMNPSDA